MQLYLIRHGEIERKEGELDDYFYNLTDWGRESIMETGEFLNSYVCDYNQKKIIISSNTLRTIESSVILSSILRSKINIFPNCQELNMGYNEAKDKSKWLYTYDGQFTNRDNFTYQQKWETKHYLGESPREVYDRLKQLKNYLITLNDYIVFVVGHGTSLRMLDMQLNNYDINWYYNEPIPKYSSVRKLILKSNNEVISDKYIRS